MADIINPSELKVFYSLTSTRRVCKVGQSTRYNVCSGTSSSRVRVSPAEGIGVRVGLFSFLSFYFQKLQPFLQTFLDNTPKAVLCVTNLPAVVLRKVENPALPPDPAPGFHFSPWSPFLSALHRNSLLHSPQDCHRLLRYHSMLSSRPCFRSRSAANPIPTLAREQSADECITSPCLGGSWRGARVVPKRSCST
jgi:hypothetical protein